MKFILLIGFLIFTSNVVHARRGGKYFKILYRTENGDNLHQIVFMFTRKRLSKRRKSSIVRFIKEQNPHIKEWNFLTAGKKIKLIFKSKEFDKNGLRKYLTLKKQREIERKKMEKYANTIHNISIFYLYTSSQITESNNIADIDTNHSSPLGIKLEIVNNIISVFQLTTNFSYQQFNKVGDVSLSNRIEASTALSVPKLFWDLSPLIGLNYFGFSNITVSNTYTTRDSTFVSIYLGLNYVYEGDSIAFQLGTNIGKSVATSSNVSGDVDSDISALKYGVHARLIFAKTFSVGVAYELIPFTGKVEGDAANTTISFGYTF